MKNKLPGDKFPGNKLPCEVVRDLFPSYIDGLTSETTTELVNEHVAECEPCKNVLNAMREPSVQPINAEDKKEVDFLKKNRVRNRVIALGSVVAAVLVVATVLFIRTFFVGRTAYAELMAWDLDVNGSKMNIEFMVGRQHAVSAVDYEEDAGIVRVSVEYVGRSIFNNKSDFKSEYVADENIKQIWIGDRIIWSQGEKISSMTSKVYNTAHSYVGDMSANFETIVAMDMPYYLGNFKNELQTSEEPYGWKMCLEEDISLKEQENKEQLMLSYGCVLLAVIDNLGVVEYEYTVEGEKMTLSIDTLQATHAIGKDIKECGKEVALLEDLIRQTSLNLYVYDRELSAELMQEALYIELVNCTPMSISSWSLTYYLDDEVCGTQNAINADGSLVKVGETIAFTLAPEDFMGREWNGVDEVKVSISICDENGNEYEVTGIDSFQKEFWVRYKFMLQGNPEDGFIATQ